MFIHSSLLEVLQLYKNINMLKLVVLSVLVAIVVAAPHPGGYLHSSPIAYGYPVATSHSSRVDYHSKPIITTYTSPLISTHALVSPVIKDYGYGSLYGGYGGYGNYGYGSHGYGNQGYGYGYGW